MKMWWEEQRSMLPFRDRAEAGRLLGSALGAYAGRGDLLVLALPRGGIPVAYEVAKSLGAPLDVFMVRKLGAPGNEELAIGAAAPGGICILQEQTIAELQIADETVRAIAGQVEKERRESEALYRSRLPPQSIAGKVAIVVDDGIATGATMRAAIAALREIAAKRVVVAVPVAPVSGCRELRSLADELTCLATPEIFFTVGQWYVNFEQVSDEELVGLLEQAATLV